MRYLLISLLLWILTPPANAINIEKNCDIPGNSYRHEKLKDELECQKLCESEDRCKSFTFISHWNRCNLMDQVKKKFQVTMIAGYIDDRDQSKATLSKLFENSDSTGKDMQSDTKLKSADECGKACLSNEKCLSFVYIQGYSMCWLKKTKGKIVPKTFSCGVK